MRPLLRWCAIIAIAVGLAPAGADAGEWPARPVKLRYHPLYILEAVARQMNVVLRPEVPLPAIMLESATPLRRFQDAIAPQWRFRPPVYANAYVAARNEIYLMDDAAYYTRLNRTLDESLAHEFAHYIQVHYFNARLEDDSLELDAIAVQQRFTEGHPPSLRAAAAH